MRALVFGASAGIGRHLTREFAASGYDLTLLARDERDLEAEASHCTTMFGVQADCIAVDAADVERLSHLLEAYLRDTKHQFRVLVFPVGGTVAPDEVTQDAASIEAIVNSNLTSIMIAIGHLQPRLEQGVRCTIVGFGSIASARGRSQNVAYSAAKRGLQCYFESLRHALAESDVAVQFYQLGYVATQQSFGKRLALPAASPVRVARRVVADLSIKFGSRFLPRFWSVAAQCLRVLPWCLFRRLRF